MSKPEVAVLVAYYLALAVLSLYSVHRFYLVRLRRRHAAAREEPAAPERWPSVTIQLPLFNEANVASRLIDAACAIEYDGQLTVQVLDDSTDETTRIIDGHPLRHRIVHVRRASRDGFKAGALAHGMQLSDAELFAVFDADFVPHPDFLKRTVPYFFAPDPALGHALPEGEGSRGIGMVQARWTHLNRDQSLLTRVQAIFLDAHFAVESAARHFSGRFF